MCQNKSKCVNLSKLVKTCLKLFLYFFPGNQNSSHHNRGTPPPGNMKTASRPVNSNTGLGGSGGLNSGGRGGTSGLGNSGSGHHNMKNVLTPVISNFTTDKSQRAAIYHYCQTLEYLVYVSHHKSNRLKVF